MAGQIFRDRIEQAVSAVASAGVGAFTLGAAVAGRQALGAGDDGKVGWFVAEEGTAWETFKGTYTHSGTSLARTSRKDSSTGSAVVFTAAAVVYIDAIATAQQMASVGLGSMLPGGRLTLTTGVPITSADVIGATSIFYTPHIHDGIALWDGDMWVPVTFPEKTLAIGTVAANIGFDIFGFLSSGALALEKLAWTDANNRATGISIQGGRPCKTGDKTRLWLGGFYSMSTTETEDSAKNRMLFNAYHRTQRSLFGSDGGSYFNTVSAFREWGATTATRVSWFSGIDALGASGSANGEDDTGFSVISAWVNGSVPNVGSRRGSGLSAGNIGRGDGWSVASILGLNYAAASDFGSANGPTFTEGRCVGTCEV